MMTNMVKTSLLSLKIAVTSLLLLTSINALAARCIDVFPTVLSSSANKGKAEFDRNVILNGTNGSINIKVNKDLTTNDNPSCVSQKCADSAIRSEVLDLPSFMTSSSNKEKILFNGEIRSLPQGAYKKIKLNYQATVRFTKNSNVTFVKDLNANKTDTTIIFEEGVYWIENFHIGFNSKIIINGSDKVTLIIKNTHFDKVDTSFNVNGTPEQLVFITYNNVKFGHNARFKGFIYAGENDDKKVELANDSIFIGAINGKEIKLKYKAAITYAPNSIKSANFNGFCSLDDSTLPAPVPKLDYRFDECSYTGLAGDVIAQTGNFNGTSNGISESFNEAVINTSLDLSADNTSDWVDVPSGAVHGLNDFSVSVWFKTSVSKSQQEIFHALGQNTNDDELEIFLKGEKTVYIKVRDESEELESDIELTDDRWHHLVISRKNKKVCLFIDGKSKGCSNGVESGMLSVNNSNAVVIGQEQDSFGGSFDKDQNFVGQLDEFKIFNEKLSSTQISNIYNNELAERNYNDPVKKRDPEFCSIPVPELEYRFDEVSWNGSTDEVEDNSYNELDGIANGNTNTITDGQVCRAGAFDGAGDITIDDLGSYLDSTASLSFWIKTEQKGNDTPWYAPGITGIEHDGGGDDIFWGYIDASGRIGMQKGNGASAVSTTSFSEPNNKNKWHHVVLTWGSDNGDVQVFVNGVLEASETSESGDVGRVFSSVGRIKDSQSNKNFIGELDEVLVFTSIISASDVQSIYINQSKGLNFDGTARSGNCNSTPTVDHYEISYSGQGLTCEPKEVTVKACTNSDYNSCTVSSDKLPSLNIKVQGSSFPFPVDRDTGEAYISYTTPGYASLSLSGTGLPTACSDTSDKGPCLLPFDDTGFKFSSIKYPQGISKQRSGELSTDVLSLQAIKTNTLTGACEAALQGNIPIEFSATCVNPNTCQNGIIKINGFDIPTVNKSVTKTYTPITLNFGGDTDDAATFNFVYPDAGEVKLYAQYDIPVGVTPSGDYMKGVSNKFFVIPKELKVSTIGIDNSVTGTHKAGEDFVLTVKALNSIGDVTPNYVSNQIQFKLTRKAPTLNGSVEGSLSYATDRSLLTSTLFQDVTLDKVNPGVFTYSGAQYSEVGEISLRVKDPDYGVLGIPSSADFVFSRFIPDHFKQTIANDVNGAPLNGVLSTTCDDGDVFAYSGQPMSLIQNSLLFEITAYNKQGNITYNYDGDYMNLTADGIEVTASSSEQGNTGPLTLTSYTEEGGLEQISGGVLRYKLVNDNFEYEHSANSLMAPFPSNIELVVEIEDADLVNLTPSDSSKLPTSYPAVLDPIEIRFGRLVLKNSFGPATSNLPQPLQVEYFDGINFVISSDDTCTRYDDSQLTSAPLIPVFGGQDFFVDGESTDIYLDPPVAGHEGDVDVIYTAPSWLQYDWITDGEYTANPTAVATFGLFRGNDRLIYRRRLN